MLADTFTNFYHVNCIDQISFLFLNYCGPQTRDKNVGTYIYKLLASKPKQKPYTLLTMKKKQYTIGCVFDKGIL